MRESARVQGKMTRASKIGLEHKARREHNREVQAKAKAQEQVKGKARALEGANEGASARQGTSMSEQERTRAQSEAK